MVAFHGGLALMALFFGATVVIGGSPVTPDLYGPVVYEIPAIAWASVQLLGASISVIGAWTRHGMVLAIGSGISVVVYGFFAAAASLAEQGTIVQGATLFVGAPGSVLTFIAGVGAKRRAR